MSETNKHNILGVQVSAVNYEDAVDQIIIAAHAKQPLALSALAVHGVMTGVLDPEHRYRLNHLDMITPDGQPVRWALNWLHGLRLSDRVYGPTLMLKVCERAAQEKLPIYLYGSQSSTVKALVDNLQNMFPNLLIAGYSPSKFRRLSEEEKQTVVAQIKNCGAAITFVGLGCPRQEVWAYEYREALSMPILAVGAAFDFHAKLLAQAPPSMQKLGLEWLFRLVKEPRRLWKRYLTLNPYYLWLVFLQRFGLRRFDHVQDQPPLEEIRYG
jgi:N-acetylglucosaminyldiphosphoundecaprenol N-acetyl-beta-D-mannosaminyltransferase